MVILSSVSVQIERLRALVPGDVPADGLVPAMRALGDDDLIAVTRCLSDARTELERMLTAAAAVIGERSARSLGQSGLSVARGHRTPVALVQAITGGTRAEAARAVRLGESLIDGAVSDAASLAIVASVGADDGAGAGLSAADGDALPASAPAPWHDSLRRAMIRGRLTPSQHDAILRGLGDPPAVADADPGEVQRVWALAAERLMAEAAVLDVEALHTQARQAREALDAASVEERFARRHERRSFRVYADADGQKHAHVVFDDEGAAWVQAVLDAALRPRRGGPRFMTDHERAAAGRLSEDPRSNEQLGYDLVLDLLRAGALADAPSVFGARQPGVRMVVLKDAVGPRDAFSRLSATAHLEDRGDAVPAAVLDRALCDAGSVDVVVDSCGNPLDVGREQRLFTPRQRLALAVRDGGCMWSGCRVPASYCESHHIDHWSADAGGTDVDRGLLLCRFHHLLLHNQGWKVHRNGRGPFLLAPPGGDPQEWIPLESKSAVRWAWDPPPRSGGGWRAA